MKREYEILQLKNDVVVKRFMDLGSLRELGLKPEREDYVSVLRADIPDTETDITYFMETIFAASNTGALLHSGHSMSVSDVILIRSGDNEEYFYCDSVGFKQIHWQEDHPDMEEVRAWAMTMKRITNGYIQKTFHIGFALSDQIYQQLKTEGIVGTMGYVVKKEG